MKNIILLFCLVLTGWQINAQDYCTDGGPTSAIDSNVESVDLVGETTSISYVGCQPDAVTGVEDLTATQTADVIAGNSYTADVQFGTCGGNFGGAGEAWIDFDRDGVFEDSESLGTVSGTPPFALESFDVTIPNDALNGTSRMRVMQWEGGTLPLDPCASFTWGSVVDFEIVISGGIDITCEQPFNVQLVEAFGSSADFSWDLAPNDQNGYIWEVFNAGDDPDVDTPVSTGTVGSGVSTVNADGLAELTDYEFYVTTDCGATDGLSPRSNPVAFTTVFLCPAPTNVTIDGVMSDAFNINWIEIPNATNGYTWSVFNSGDDPTADTALFTGTEPFGTTTTSVTGLTENTSYDVYVSADCDTDGTSELSNVVTVTTPCLPVSAPIIEDFDGSNWASGTGFGNDGSTIDNCWSRIPDGTNGDYFWGTRTATTGSTGTGPSAANTGTNYIYTEATNGVTGDEAFFVSPLMDLSTLNEPALTFYYHMFGVNMGTLSVDVDAGSGFDLDVFSISGEQQSSESEDFTEQIVDLSAYSGQTVKIRFRGTKGADFESDMAIDDFSVDEAPTCIKPSNLLVEEVFTESVEISWSAISNATAGYIWEAYQSGDDPAVDASLANGTFPAGTTTGVATGLSELTDYDLYLKSDCDTDGMSELAGPLSFSTLAICPSPASISVDNLTENSADINWDESFNASNGYDWELFFDGADPAIDTPLQNGNEAFGTTTLNLTGLTENTNYDFYITSDCDTDGMSLTEGPIDFLTLPIPPDNDDICDAIPLTVGIIPPGDTYTNLGATAQTNEPVAQCFNDGINGSVWFTFVAPDSGEVEVSTDIAGASLVDTEIAAYEAPTDCTDPSTIGAELGCNQDGGVEIGFNSIVNLSGLTSGDTYYVQVDRWGSADDGNFGISVIDTNPPCPTPENVVNDSVTDTTADFSWDDVSEATDGYNWFVFNQGDDTTTATPVFSGNEDAGVLNVNVTGLTSDTIYDFYVQSDCGSSVGTSSLGASTTFQTDCVPFTTPFTEDFETFDTTDDAGEFVREDCFEDLSPEFDYRWNISEGSTPSGVSGPSTGNSGSQYIFADSNTGFGVQTAILETPIFDLTGLSQPTLSFFYHMFGSDVGSLTVDVDNGTTVDSDVITFNGSQQSTSTEPWKVAFVDLSAYSGQNVKFIFRATRTNTFQGSDIALDDISVDEAPDCLPANNISIANIGDTSVDLSWDGNSTASSYNWELFLAGDDPDVETPLFTGNETNTAFTLSGLTASTSYDFYVTTDCGANGESLVTGPLNFATAGCPVVNQCDFTFILKDTFGDGWNGNTMDVIQDGVVIATLGSSFTDGAEFTEVVSLCDGSNFELFWNDGGGFQGEVGVEIIDPFDEQLFELIADTANTNDTSLFTDVISCTPPPCPKPGGLSVTNLLPTSVTLNWGDNGNAVNGYNWSIFLEGDDPTVETPLFSGSTTDGITSEDVTGLTQFESYDFYVEADCGSVDGVSSLDGPFTFSTPCDIFTPPYSEDFNDNGADIPTCWTQGNDNDEDWQFDIPAFSNIGNDGNLSGNTLSDGGFAWVSDGFSHNTGTRLLSPFVDVSSLSVPQLSFFFISDNQGSTNVDFSVEVWDGAAWNQVFFSDQNSQNGAWEEVVILLDNLNITGNIQVAFQVDENNGNDFSDDLAIDDVEIKEAPTCPRPVTNPGITIQNITDVSAEVNWMPALTTQTEFDLELVLSGDAPTGTPTNENVTNIPFTLTGLSSETEYDVYVRADCGGGDESDWIGPATFQTAITPVNVDINNPSTGNTYCYDNSEFKEWLFVKTGSSNEDLKLTFNAGLMETDPASADRLVCYDGFDDTAPILYDSDMDGNDLTDVTITSTSGALYMTLSSDQFGSCQNGTEALEEIDFDVFVGTLSSTAFDDHNFDFYPNPVDDRLILKAQSNMENVVLFNMIGQKVKEFNSLNNSSFEIPMSNLQAGAYLMKVNIEGVSNIFRVIKK